MLSEKPAEIQDSLGIANEYLNHQTTVAVAATKLTEHGPFGTYVAGEILLEEAAKDDAAYPVRDLIDLAKSSFRQVVSATEDIPVNSEHICTRARAAVRLAQMPLFQTIHEKRIVPHKQASYEAYQKLVRLGGGIMDALNGASFDANGPVELYGFMSEIAVLLLAQRAYLANIIPKIALQSLFSEDHGGNCLVATNSFAWDISTFVPNRDRTGITRTNTMQIRTTKKPDGEEPLGPTLYVCPDLALHPKEKNVARAIIARSHTDRFYDNTKKLVKTLYDRSRQLCTFLNTTETPVPLYKRTMNKR